ncbi:MAG: ParB/RepB/Spo0J family partition protein, partial [Planctomycetaceae bacterium]
VANPKDVGRRALRSFGTLAIENLMPDPDQPRTQFDAEELQQLAESIRTKGQLHPVRVRWSEPHGKWIIVSGERRYRASVAAGFKSVQCHFIDGELSKSEILEQQLVENLLRAELKPIEEARAFEQLRTLTGWNSKQLAEAINVPASKVTRVMALLRLPEDIQQQVESGALAARAAYELTKLPDNEQRRKALSDVGQSGDRVTVGSAQRQVRKQKGIVITRGSRQTFFTEEGWKFTATSPGKSTYHEMERALQQVLEEVRGRIEANIEL